MCVLSKKVPMRKKSGKLFDDLHICVILKYINACVCVYVYVTMCARERVCVCVIE